jgi:uncharacterized membrane protein YsdA (DUF1294 family)
MPLLLALWAGLLVWGLRDQHLGIGALVGLAALNAATWIAYAVDKQAARRGGRRIREDHLHVLSLMGGWPAAAWAQRSLRHKTAKPAFVAVFRATVALHLAGLATWLFAQAGLPGT